MFKQKIKLPFKAQKIALGLGSQTKNTLCFIKGEQAFLSEVRADLDLLQSREDFQKELKRLLSLKPRVIGYDLHPQYASMHIAARLEGKMRLVKVQHHYAHVLACMVENGLANNPVIGVALDGTGLGSDGKLWGAEFLVCDYRTFSRRAHLKEVELLGGEAAILEPWRLTAFWLNKIYGNNFCKLKIDFLQKFPYKKWQQLNRISLSGFGFPQASSMGRLFDAASSLILAKDEAHFEAELAIDLEKAASRAKNRSDKNYSYRIAKAKDGVKIIDPTEIFKGIVQDLRAKAPTEKIALRFHYTIAQITKNVCTLIRKEAKINKVCLSGGVFQNKVLEKLIIEGLTAAGFNVFVHQKLSCNDSCISLGQAVAVLFNTD